MEEDIRWQQRFSNYVKALHKLEQAVDYILNIPLKDVNESTETHVGEVLDEIIKEGLIQRFEYTHELAWNVMKDFLTNAGNNNIYGSKDSTREAFAANLITDGEVWMDMIKSRNKTSHTYNEETADDIFHKIVHEYYPAFNQFKIRMEALRSGEHGKLL
jgi:nucleotidyltransferase substrate binding protein (TIGR01987 family)